MTVHQVEVEFKKAWAAANFSVDGGGGASAAELEEARGKRNSALLARQKFEQEAPKAVGGVSAPKSGSKKVCGDSVGILQVSSGFLIALINSIIVQLNCREKERFPQGGGGARSSLCPSSARRRWASCCNQRRWGITWRVRMYCVQAHGLLTLFPRYGHLFPANDTTDTYSPL